MTGLFRVENEYTKKIGLQGEGIKCIMVSKALKRIGIQADVKSENEDKITVLPNNYILKLAGKEIVCKTIADVLERLN